VATLVAVLEKGAQGLLAQQDARGALPHSYALVVAILNRYLRVRYFVLEHWALAILFGFVAPLRILVGVKRWLAALYRWREERSGMAFKQERYDFPRVEASLARLMAANPDVDHQVVLGIDERGQPVYLTDEARSMHLHVLGQTGSGKTKSVIEPLLFQDIVRGRGALAGVRAGLLLRTLSSPQLLDRPTRGVILDLPTDTSPLPFAAALAGFEYRTGRSLVAGLMADYRFAGSAYQSVSLCLELSWMTY
jgi:hypothetical protein